MRTAGREEGGEPAMQTRQQREGKQPGKHEDGYNMGRRQMCEG